MPAEFPPFAPTPPALGARCVAGPAASLGPLRRGAKTAMELAELTMGGRPGEALTVRLGAARSFSLSLPTLRGAAGAQRRPTPPSFLCSVHEPHCWVALPPALLRSLFERPPPLPLPLLLTTVAGALRPALSSPRRFLTAPAIKKCSPSPANCIGEGAEAQSWHVAWAGGASGGGLGTLDVPRALAAEMGGLADGARVRLRALPAPLPAALAVELEPAGPDDWEILELHAGHVEEQLLNQAGLVAVGAGLPVWIQQVCSLARRRP